MNLAGDGWTSKRLWSSAFDYFVDQFVDATNRLSFAAIDEHAALRDLFGDPSHDKRPVYFPKVKISSYDQEVFRNHLARAIRPLIERYFGKMDAHDDEFMSACYISRREYRESEENVNQVIYDTLSPYFRDYNVRDLFEEAAGGEFFERIPSGLRDKKSRDVIVLFGGKGSGKSTLASRLLFHRPPNSIKYFSVPVVVDLVECPEDKALILDEVNTQLLSKVDTANLLTADRDSILELFDDRFAIAKKQNLAGLPADSVAYNTKLNELVQEWKSDPLYVAQKLADHWKRHRKGVVVVLDNTDQYSPDIQEYCFTLAQMIATKLDCLVIISMREERFYVSKIAGTLDAFHNSGFHLTSPPPRELFVKRLRYVSWLLKQPDRIKRIAPEMSVEQARHLRVLLGIFRREFRSEASHLADFVQACAHGNMRLALDFFREFVLSGYTRVDEMLATPRWTLQVHQVLRPMMVPYRFFYDERKSEVPNVFQIRSPERGSNLTGLRLLNFLSKGQAATNPNYVPVAKIWEYFSALGMVEDAQFNLDEFLKKGIVESDKRIDFFDKAIDSVKITAYGIYLAETLCHNFSYLELVCLDCGVHSEPTANDLARCGNDDLSYFFSSKKKERMEIRVTRVRTFVDYLAKEEKLEHTYVFPHVREPKLVPELRRRYDDDEQRVLRSARRALKKSRQDDQFGEFDYLAEGDGNATEEPREPDAE